MLPELRADPVTQRVPGLEPNLFQFKCPRSYPGEAKPPCRAGGAGRTRSGSEGGRSSELRAFIALVDKRAIGWLLERVGPFHISSNEAHQGPSNLILSLDLLSGGYFV